MAFLLVLIKFLLPFIISPAKHGLFFTSGFFSAIAWISVRLQRSLLYLRVTFPVKFKYSPFNPAANVCLNLWLWGTQLSMILGCFACLTYRSQRRRKKARKKMETRKRRTRKWIKSSWFVLLSVWDRRGQRIPPTPKVRFLFPLKLTHRNKIVVVVILAAS